MNDKNFKNKNVLVAGGGGFIGGWIVDALLEQGAKSVRVIDVKQQNDWYQLHDRAENIQSDLSLLEETKKAVDGIDIVINLAADMGGMGFIENNKAKCMLSVLINTNLLKSSMTQEIESFFFASSACVYRNDLQKNKDAHPLKEEDAYPASPEDGYGWEKLFSERMTRHFNEDFGLNCRIARFHNVYGPYGTYDGGREKAPAAICRKIAHAKKNGLRSIEIWGDGTQTRSFMYAQDCVTGVFKLLDSDFVEPINLGSSRQISINELVTIVENIAGIKLEREYNLDAPRGVNGRNSDNTLIKEILGWEPNYSLEIGLEQTFKWIYDKI